MQNGSPVGPREPVPSTSAAGDNNNKNYGRTPLHEAAIAGDDEALERLLRAGADRNSKDTQHGNTPLHEAGMCNFVKFCHCFSKLIFSFFRFYYSIS